MESYKEESFETISSMDPKCRACPDRFTCDKKRMVKWMLPPKELIENDILNYIQIANSPIIVSKDYLKPKKLDKKASDIIPEMKKMEYEINLAQWLKPRQTLAEAINDWARDQELQEMNQGGLRNG